MQYIPTAIYGGYLKYHHCRKNDVIFFPIKTAVSPEEP